MRILFNIVAVLGNISKLIQPAATIGDAEEFSSIITNLAALVNFELHPEKPEAVPMENSLRFIVVCVNGVFVRNLVVAVRTAGYVVGVLLAVCMVV